MTDRDLALEGLDRGMTAGRAFDDHLDGLISLVRACDILGVPVIQLVRWCGDGTVPESAFTGDPVSPGRLRFDPAWVEGWALERAA